MTLRLLVVLPRSLLFVAKAMDSLVIVPFFRVLPHLDAVLCARVVVGFAVRPVLVAVRRTVDPLVQVHQV